MPVTELSTAIALIRQLYKNSGRSTRISETSAGKRYTQSSWTCKSKSQIWYRIRKIAIKCLLNFWVLLSPVIPPRLLCLVRWETSFTHSLASGARIRKRKAYHNSLHNSVAITEYSVLVMMAYVSARLKKHELSLKKVCYKSPLTGNQEFCTGLVWRWNVSTRITREPAFSRETWEASMEKS